MKYIFISKIFVPIIIRIYRNMSKRRFTPFPSAAIASHNSNNTTTNTSKESCEVVCSSNSLDTTTNTILTKIDHHNSYITIEDNEQQLKKKIINQKNDLDILRTYLPENHEYSIQLVNESITLHNKLFHGIDKISIISKGLLEIILNTGNTQGYV